MDKHRITRTRWPRGTWMKLTSRATLRALMAQKDVSLQDLGNAAGVSKGFVSHLTAGRKSTCTPRVADAIARRLDVPIELLFVPSVSTSSTTFIKGQRTAA
jgi:transcriptional regulator with XRE-family HTH domain